jgi:hypothetical protein
MDIESGNKRFPSIELLETIEKGLIYLMDEAESKPIQLAFPAEVIDRLDVFGKPSWELVRIAFHSQQSRLDELGLEAMELFQDEDSFCWPVDHPLRCLAIGILRELAERFLDEGHKHGHLTSKGRGDERRSRPLMERVVVRPTSRSENR